MNHVRLRRWARNAPARLEDFTMDVSPQTLSLQWDAARDDRRRILVELIASRERVIQLYAYRDVPCPAGYAQEVERELAIQRERLARNVADLAAFDMGE